MQRQYDAGTKLGPNHRLRVFPLWYDHVRKGSSTVHLSKTIGLGAAAATMGRADLSDLASRQVQWVLGANPFSRSLLYGVGHAFWQNFTVALPNFVGGMSLGFNSYEEDAPSWGNNAVFPYKEMWVYSSCRMALNLSRVGAGARITGSAPAGASFVNARTGERTAIRPGRLDLRLPAGEYDVRHGSTFRRIALADGTTVPLDLDPGKALSLTAELKRGSASRTEAIVTAAGAGRRRLTMRAWNARVEGFEPTMGPEGGSGRLALSIEPVDRSKPWFVHLDGPRGTGGLEIRGAGESSATSPRA